MQGPADNDDKGSPAPKQPAYDQILNGASRNDDPVGSAQRLFFALWPESTLQQQLYAVGERLARENRARHVHAENVHLTLAFLGSVSAPTRECLERGADAIGGERFTLMLDHIGCFRRAGVLWAGAPAVPRALLHLVQSLNAVLEACGLVPEERAFQAHVTLARKLRRCPPKQPIGPFAWPVERFCLVQSHMQSSGVRYEILCSWPLAEGE